MPDALYDSYRSDSEHFSHAYEHLFTPALNAAGYDAVSPVTKGSEIIHSEIIKNLESSDLVLCDISILNPNVFFELGIRTALNKPVCLIKDDKTSNIPFDTHIINCYTYNSSMNLWEADEQIKNLSQHINSTSTDTNALWKIFGFTDVGGMNELQDNNDQLKYKDLLIKNLEMKINSLENDKSKVVNPEKYTLHKCSKCGHGFQIADEYSNIGFSLARHSHLLSNMTDIYGQNTTTMGLKCPVCGNIDKV